MITRKHKHIHKTKEEHKLQQQNLKPNKTGQWYKRGCHVLQNLSNKTILTNTYNKNKA